MVGATSQQCDRTMRGIVGLVVGSLAVAGYVAATIFFLSMLGVIFYG